MPLPPLTILHGEDDFAAAERIGQLKAALGDPSVASLNISEFDGRSVSLAELRAACDTVPFLADRRLIIVTGLLAQNTGRTGGGAQAPDSASRDLVDGLIAYFGMLPQTTTLVLVEPRVLHERSRLLKAAAKVPGAEIVRLEAPKGAALSRWIMGRAKARGGEFSRAGAEALAAAAGHDTRLLASEIDKLLAYVNWGRPVDQADVERLTPAAGEAVIWDLVDAIGARNARVALDKFHALVAMPSQDQFAIFGMIVRQFRLLLQTREILEHGGHAPQVVQALDQRPFVADKLIRQARNFTLAQLESIYHSLLELDLTLKSGGAEDTTAVDAFIATVTT